MKPKPLLVSLAICGLYSSAIAASIKVSSQNGLQDKGRVGGVALLVPVILTTTSQEGLGTGVPSLPSPVSSVTAQSPLSTSTARLGNIQRSGPSVPGPSNGVLPNAVSASLGTQGGIVVTGSSLQGHDPGTHDALRGGVVTGSLSQPARRIGGNVAAVSSLPIQGPGGQGGLQFGAGVSSSNQVLSAGAASGSMGSGGISVHSGSAARVVGPLGHSENLQYLGAAGGGTGKGTATGTGKVLLNVQSANLGTQSGIVGTGSALQGTGPDTHDARQVRPVTGSVSQAARGTIGGNVAAGSSLPIHGPGGQGGLQFGAGAGSSNQVLSVSAASGSMGSGGISAHSGSTARVVGSLGHSANLPHLGAAGAGTAKGIAVGAGGGILNVQSANLRTQGAIVGTGGALQGRGPGTRNILHGRPATASLSETIRGTNGANVGVGSGLHIQGAGSQGSLQFGAGAGSSIRGQSVGPVSGNLGSGGMSVHSGSTVGGLGPLGPSASLQGARAAGARTEGTATGAGLSLVAVPSNAHVVVVPTAPVVAVAVPAAVAVVPSVHSSVTATTAGTAAAPALGAGASTLPVMPKVETSPQHRPPLTMPGAHQLAAVGIPSSGTRVEKDSHQKT